jgi:hypothetical protein
MTVRKRIYVDGDPVNRVSCQELVGEIGTSTGELNPDTVRGQTRASGNQLKEMKIQ